MSIDRILERAKKIKQKEVIWLIPILLLVFFLTFYPHLDYPYLLHVDEWFHVAQAKQVVLGSDVNWYSGEQFNLGMERAWHTMLASVYFLFKPSITQWIFLPTVLHALAVLSVYYFVSKLYSKKEAFISSLLIALIPSNVTMGGPVFLVPINLSLIFIPLALLFAFGLIKIKTSFNYLLLFIIATFLLYAHPPTAVALLTILGFYFLLNVFSKNNECKQKAKFLFITILLSTILSLPNYLPEIQNRGLESITFDFWVYLQEIPLIYGILPTIFFIIGFYFLTKTEKKETWCLILTAIILILNVFLFTRSGSSYIMPYQRTHIPLFLLMSII
jgi:4-amino-4-deoxy-L-arabinose transferase-like glycosyltransferase